MLFPPRPRRTASVAASRQPWDRWLAGNGPGPGPKGRGSSGMQPFPMQSGCLAWISATRCRRSWQAASRSRPWRTPGCRPLRPCGRRLTCSSRSTPSGAARRSRDQGSRSHDCVRGWSAGGLRCPLPCGRSGRRAVPPAGAPRWLISAVGCTAHGGDPGDAACHRRGRRPHRRRAQGRTIPTSPGPGAWGADRRGPAALTVHEPALGRTIPSGCLRWPTRSGGRPRGGPCQVDPAGDEADVTEGLRVVAEGRAGGRLDLLWQQPQRAGTTAQAVQRHGLADAALPARLSTTARSCTNRNAPS